MDPFGQEAFLRTIRLALGHASRLRPSGDELFKSEFTTAIDEMIQRVRNRSKTERYQLLDQLIESAKPIHLHIVPLQDTAAAGTAIAELAKKKEPEWGNQKSIAAWKHPLLDRMNLPAALAVQKVPLYFTELENIEAADASRQKKRDRLRQRIIDAYIGVTAADFCMADTATLVMRTRPGQARSVSLLPSIHIAVITLDQIIADLKELYVLLKWDSEVKQLGLSNCMTFISGPSKTADVEATMVHGAHGPREVYIYVVTREGADHFGG
jgi:L-lactate dehydrogenase complex protein LldG